MDIASLGFSIDTSDVSKAEAALDGLNSAGVKTEATAKGVGSAWSEAGRRGGSAASQLGSTAGAVRQGNAAFREQQAELTKLLGRIDPVIKRLGELDSMEKELRNFKLAGVIELDSFNEYQNKIDFSRRSLTAFDDVLFRTGNTSKQTAAALRQLPAQFSDIFISLQAGQSPLTVFLQQGAQIKDSFGGAGPALRETARYALGLVNPFTVAAAAAVALGVAYKQGSDEATAFNTALILTGNAAGTTVGQLGNMARTIDGTVGTQRQAAAALAEVAGTGKFAADQIQAVATAAIAMEEATGKAVSETVAEFKKLADEPAAASAKLNEQYNYLTASVYAQIAALEAQGDAVGAQELAIETFGDAMERRAHQIEGNLGLIESAWKGIKNVAAEAWDEMLGVGRETTMQEQLEQLRRARIEASYGPRGDRAFPSLTDSQSSRFDAEEQRLLLGIQSEGLDAATEGLRAKNQKRAIQGLELIGKEAEAARSNVEKLRDRLSELGDARSFNISNRSWTSDAQEQYEKSVAALNKQISDAEERANRTRRQAAFREDAGTRMLDNLRQQYAQLTAQDEATKRLSASQRELVKFQQQIADIKSKSILTADQKSLLASSDLITAQLQRNAAVEQELSARKAVQDAMGEYNKLAASLLTKEERQLAVTRERLAILDRVKDSALSDDEYNKITSAIASKSTIEAPKFGGLDASIGGVGGEIERINQAERDLEGWYATQLELINGFRKERSDLTEQWNEQEAVVKQQHEDRMLAIEQARQRTTLAVAGEVFGNLATLAQSENKKLVSIGKAAAIAQATISGFQAVQNALAVPPYPLGLALAVTAGAATAANIAGIAGVGFRQGGYTGNGGVNDVAGFVHGREFVFDAESVSRIGVGNLEALRAGRDVSMASAGGAASSPAFSQPSPSRDMSITQNNYFRQADNRTATQSAKAISREQRQVQSRLGG